MKLVDRLLTIQAEEERAFHSAMRSDVAWRDDMIRELREALKFYADEKNYLQHGWQGDLDPSRVDSDNGKIARAALLPSAKVASSGS